MDSQATIRGVSVVQGQIQQIGARETWGYTAGAGWSVLSIGAGVVV